MTNLTVTTHSNILEKFIVLSPILHLTIYFLHSANNSESLLNVYISRIDDKMVYQWYSHML